MYSLFFDINSYLFELAVETKFADRAQLKNINPEVAIQQLKSLNNELERIYDYQEAIDCIEKFIFKKRQRLKSEYISSFDMHTAYYLVRIKEQSTILDIVNFHQKLIDRQLRSEMDNQQMTNVIFQLFDRATKQYRKHNEREAVMCTLFLSCADFY